MPMYRSFGPHVHSRVCWGLEFACEQQIGGFSSLLALPLTTTTGQQAEKVWNIAVGHVKMNVSSRYDQRCPAWAAATVSCMLD